MIAGHLFLRQDVEPHILVDFPNPGVVLDVLDAVPVDDAVDEVVARGDRNDVVEFGLGPARRVDGVCVTS